MAQVQLPYQFVDGTTAFGDQVYANDVALANAINNGLDWSNIGPAGIYASQIIPNSPATATFGGTQTYVFPAGVTATGALTGASVMVSGTITAGGALTAGTIAAGGYTTTGVPTPGSYVAGASSYGPLAAVVAGPIMAQNIAGNTSAHLPPVYTTAGADWGAGLKMVWSPQSGTPFNVNNGDTSETFEVPLTGDAVFTNPPFVIPYFDTNSVAGWTDVKVSVGYGASTITFVIRSATGASIQQTAYLTWLMCGV